MATLSSGTMRAPSINMKRTPLFWAGCGFVVAVLLVVWAISSAERGESARKASAGEPAAVRTSGISAKIAYPDDTARALEQMTGATSEATLIGRHVEVEASPDQVDGPTVFWADTRHGGQVLVMLARDRRTEAQRYSSQVAPVSMEAQPGREVKVSGTIQRVPSAADRSSWGFYDPAHDDALTARVYLKADGVTSQ